MRNIETEDTGQNPHEKRGSATEKNLQKTKKTKKWVFWQKIIMKQWIKSLQKIRQAGNHPYNAKKQKSKYTNKQIIVYNTYQNTVQMAKMKQTKTMYH